MSATGQRAHARGGELERQRNALEPRTPARRPPALRCSVSAKLGLCSCARSTNSCTAGDRASASTLACAIGTGSGCTEYVCSPGNAQRIAARWRGRGLRARRAESRWRALPTSSITCSQLSRISSSLRDFRCAHKRLQQRPPGLLAHAEHLRAVSLATSESSRIGCRSMNQTPSGYASITLGGDLQRQAASCRGRPCRAASAAACLRAAPRFRRVRARGR